MNSPDCYPGTMVPVTEVGLLTGIFAATNGITLSQVCEITGLESGTVQNWVKRGFVNPPEGRKYSENHLARIILINLLRETFIIERIAKLLSYVNGDLLDRADDIMDDSDIYQCLCDIIICSEAQSKKGIDSDQLHHKIEEQLRHYSEPYPGAKARLKLALEAMVYAYQSAYYKGLANKLTEKI